MTKFKVGDKIPVSALLTITGIQPKSNGRIVYQLSNGLCVPDFILGQMEIKEQKKSVEAVAEDKPEPIELYCVKDYMPGKWCTKGKVYKVDTDGCVMHDGGYREHNFLEFMKRGGKFSYDSGPWSDYLVPLVKRQAKVGEWVLIVSEFDAFDDYKNGDVLRVDKMNGDDICEYGVKGGVFIYANEYLVLDGYQPDRCKCCGQVIPEREAED